MLLLLIEGRLRPDSSFGVEAGLLHDRLCFGHILPSPLSLVRLGLAVDLVEIVIFVDVMAFCIYYMTFPRRSIIPTARPFHLLLQAREQRIRIIFLCRRFIHLFQEVLRHLAFGGIWAITVKTFLRLTKPRKHVALTETIFISPFTTLQSMSEVEGFLRTGDNLSGGEGKISSPFHVLNIMPFNHRRIRLIHYLSIFGEKVVHAPPPFVQKSSHFARTIVFNDLDGCLRDFSRQYCIFRLY